MIKTVILFEIALWALGATFIVTQIVLPAVRGRPMLPLLRRRGLSVENKLAEARENVDLSQQEMEIEHLQSQQPPAPAMAQPTVNNSTTKKRGRNV